MKAFDTDILTETRAGNPAYAERIAQILAAEQAVPIILVVHLTGPALRFSETSCSLQPARQVNAVIRRCRRLGTCR